MVADGLRGKGINIFSRVICSQLSTKIVLKLLGIDNCNFFDKGSLSLADSVLLRLRVRVLVLVLLEEDEEEEEEEEEEALELEDLGLDVDFSFSTTGFFFFDLAGFLARSRKLFNKALFSALSIYIYMYMKY